MKKIPFSPPDISQAEIDAVVTTLKSGWITTGPRTKEFEQRLSKVCRTERTVCLQSATAAMEMTLRLLGIGRGDEVITSAYTYTASASVIAHVGATIVLVDTVPGEFHLDIEQVKDKITPRTKAVIPVDIAGVMCDYDALFAALEEKRHLFQPKGCLQEAIGRVVVVADAAHALGAQRNGKVCGEVADFTCFSFHAVKNLTTAEGGAVTWSLPEGIDSNKIYQEYMILSLHGQNKDALAKSKAGSWEYDIIAPLYKCNMTDIMAALGIAQLDRFEEMKERRRAIVHMYEDALADLPVKWLAHHGDNFQSSCHLFLLTLNGFHEEKRNELIEYMDHHGVSCNVHYKPLPMLTAYKDLGFKIEDFPHAFDLYQKEITLPLHTLLQNEDVEYIAKVLHEGLGKVNGRA